MRDKCISIEASGLAMMVENMGDDSDPPKHLEPKSWRGGPDAEP
jgi:hypothetical protein